MTEPLDLGTIKSRSDAEPAERIQREAPTSFPSSKPRSLLSIAFEVVRDPMFPAAGGCRMLYLYLGDVEEAVPLLGLVFVVMGITLFPERKTERAVEALRDLSSPRVVRGGLLLTVLPTCPSYHQATHQVFEYSRGNVMQVCISRNEVPP
jgi:P-type Ca2+ transporter type 2C